MERNSKYRSIIWIEVTNYLLKGGDAYDLEKIHITRMATNQKSFQKDKYYMDIKSIS